MYGISLETLRTVLFLFTLVLPHVSNMNCVSFRYIFFFYLFWFFCSMLELFQYLLCLECILLRMRHYKKLIRDSVIVCLWVYVGGLGLLNEELLCRVIGPAWYQCPYVFFPLGLVIFPREEYSIFIFGKQKEIFWWYNSGCQQSERWSREGG